ncbi:LysR family transcriptional regulator [Flexivirga oryzae]|uniref:DNA-binding transcriptional LysR family regulator n=1 Tax=Flexivirga oryzae TaxID=1794944 RepID=A0A839N548_9MICO|nr:LysR family transcriptional regulator [Flexivirga oryzae]MBB2891879.1 DNA-binding transcriptional LysR family regulator [Flexivirga oryzae]
MSSDALHSVDANLLLSLQALLEERNLTHAGTRMNMTQPAMSGALTRLRRHFDDDLLARTSQGFELTDLGRRLVPMVAEAVAAAEALLGEAQPFRPDESTKRFMVSTSEYAMTVLAAPLTRVLAERAPGCSIAFDAMPPTRDQFEAQLLRRDLIIGPTWFDFPGSRQPVFTDHLECIVARDNGRVRDGRLSLTDLRQMPHAVSELGMPGEFPRPLEAAMERVGIVDRHVQVQVSSLLTLPFAVAGTQLCAFELSRLAERCLVPLDLIIVGTPLDRVEITEAAHWHPRRAADPAIVWLRELLYDVAIELDSSD